VRSLVRRTGAIAAILMLSVGNLMACAGWQPTPEARMACCSDETRCPMHARDSTARRQLTQAEADTCCSANSDEVNTPSAAGFAAFSAAPAPALVALVIPVQTPALAAWRTLVPHPVSPVPRHLLLTVLLV